IVLLILLTSLCSSPEFADVVFLVDSSDHLGSKSFPFVRTFISKVINSLPVETNKFRLALAQYSDDLHQEFLLNTFKTKKAMLDHLKKNVDYIGGSLRIGNALEKVHKTYFSGPANGRDKKLFPQILVVLASAKSEDDVVGPAEALQRDGVKIIALGMQDASEENLKAMATSQHHYNLRTVRDVGMFSGNMTRIIKETIKQKEGIQDVDEVVCERDSVADIVFLLDESLEVREDLEDLQRFLENITASMDVRAGCTRIGMLRFSDRAEVVTSLEALMSHAEIAQAIGSLSLRDGKAYIGKALKKAREEVFSRSRKAQGVRQIAVLVTHRSSEDEVNEAADNLLLQGVSIFAIGIEGYNITQLEQIVSYPADRFISIQKSYSDLEPYSVTFLNKLQHEIQYRMSVQHEQTERYRTGCIETEKADIYFLIDGSGSVQNYFQEIKNFMIEVTQMFIVAPEKVRFGAVQYSTDSQEEFGIGVHSNQVNLGKAILNIRQMGYTTNTGAALNFMLQVIQGSRRKQPSNIPCHLLVLTDGKSDDEVAEPAKRLREEDVIIHAIGVKGANLHELEDIAGSKDRVKFVHNFDSLKSIKDEIVQSICHERDCKDKKADIMFLVDSSGSMGAATFSKVKDFMKNFVDKSHIGIDQGHVGVIQFSNFTKEEFGLTEYMNKSDIFDAIDRMRPIGSKTYTGKALRFVSDYFEPLKGGRSGVKKFLILITDGKAHDKVEEPALDLRNKGVTILLVAIFRSKSPQLEDITGNANLVYYVESFDNQKLLEDKLVFDICTLDECKQIQKLDIVFVLDDSSSISFHQHQSMINFTMHLVNKADVGRDRVQFGALKYADDPEILFHLNTYSTKEGVIKGLTYSQGGVNTYTAKALKKSHELFTEKNGSRMNRGVKQMLVVITDGESHDSKDLEATAKTLRDKNIIIYGVGVAAASEKELFDITGSKDKYFMVDNFEKLKEIYLPIEKKACDNSLDVCDMKKADVFFLCDGSDLVTELEFGKMVYFLADIIDNLDVSSENTHVGLSQLGTLHQEIIQLNDTLDKNERKAKILATSKRNGSPRLEVALRHMKDTLVSGSRIVAGVPQILFVVLSGQPKGSVAMVNEAVAKLRELGVCIVALGIGNVRNDEFLHITHNPEKIITVSDFDSLKKVDVKKRVVREICRNCQKESCFVDTVIGFDISTHRRGQTLFEGQPHLESYLPGLLQSINSLRGVSCGRKTQVSVAFKVTTDTSFEPRFQIYEETMMETLRQVTVSGPSHLQVTDLESLWSVFNHSENHGKVILIFSDGLQPGANDLWRLEKKSDELREQGLMGLFVVALNTTTHHDDFSTIEFGKGFEYRTHLSIGMRDLSSTLTKYLDNIAERHCCCALCKCSGAPGAPGSPGSRGAKVHLEMPKCVVFISLILGKCPVYPTELVFALDVSRQRFEVVKNMTISIVKDLKIRENNCPMGAKVAVLSYSSDSRYLVRWSDYSSKRQLLQKLSRMTFQQPSYSRDLGNAMIFVARNVFKRTLPGPNVRRLTVFFSDNQSPDMSSIITATMEFSGLNIIPAVFAFNEMFALEEAFQFDDTGTYQVIPVLPSQFSEPIERLRQCTLCYDKCFPNVCAEEQVDRIHSYMDALFLLDSSRHVTGDEFEQMKSFLSLVLDSFDISKDPFQSNVGDRLALLSYSPGDFSRRKISAPVKEEFVFTTYNSKTLMKRYIQDSLKQLHGEAFVGHALQWTTERVFSNTEQSRKNKVIFVISAGENNEKKDVLRKMALRAKCQGYVIFVISLGSTREEEVEDIASLPLDHHLIQLGRIHKPNLDYAVRFIKPFVYSVRRKSPNSISLLLERRTCSLAIVMPLCMAERICLSLESAKLEIKKERVTGMGTASKNGRSQQIESLMGEAARRPMSLITKYTERSKM
uniref:Collagen alpha-5(VI) chain n=1 Tax=Vombatus ursinus TaxID=29139 RepID=A0A4X2M5L5_VOMUR